MKTIAYILLFFGTVGLTTVASADKLTSAGINSAETYSAEDFTVKTEWKKLFPEKSGFAITSDGKPAHFATTSGEELYRTLCQACHMENAQGASGAGEYPSFVGNKRLRSVYYPIDVILYGLRGMRDFGDMLSNQQVADVVNYLRTSFGNQLTGDATAEDVGRLRLGH